LISDHNNMFGRDFLPVKKRAQPVNGPVRDQKF